jgi:hypothetical protein
MTMVYIKKTLFLFSIYFSYNINNNNKNFKDADEFYLNDQMRVAKHYISKTNAQATACRMVHI